MGVDPVISAPFERSELISVITDACDRADLAVMITLPEAEPPRNLLINRGAEKLLDCTEAEFQAKSVWEWIAPEETPALAPSSRSRCLHPRRHCSKRFRRRARP